MLEQIGPYRILSPLGAGGMGEVYRAHDPMLGRDVALKLLPRELADDPDRRARMLREARAAASLNHPNICTVYEVGEAEGRTFIAMEVVEGESLAARLMQKPLRRRRSCASGGSLLMRWRTPTTAALFTAI
jgi:serine/threonine protein kinase